MSKTSKQSQIESLQAQLADTQAQLEAERETILTLETRIAEYEQNMSRAAEEVVSFGTSAANTVAKKAEQIAELEQTVSTVEAQRERAVKLATELSATLVKASVYGTGF